MKTMKSLVLGSAAALVAAVSGAQAADLPVKAKAVEYVKVCSLYGAGFYYIPGTDTCIKLGGYLRFDLLFNTTSDFNAPYSGVSGAQNRVSDHLIYRSREDLNIDTRTATEYGVVRTYFDGVFTWTSGSYSGVGNGGTAYSTAAVIGATTPTSVSVNGTQDGIAQGTLGVYYAFIQFAGFTLGKAVSQFSTPWTNYPANNFDGLVGGGGTVTGVNQITYTAEFGQGISASFSAQDQSLYTQSNIYNTSLATGGTLLGGNFGGSAFGSNWSPDFIGMVRVDQAWGLFQASVAAHDNHAAYYSNGLTGAAASSNETFGHPDDKWGWAGQLALSIKNIPTGPGDTINIQGVYTKGASRYDFQDLATTNYVMYGGTNLPGAYQSIGIGVVTDSVFANNGQQQLTTTYGFRGGYTHNWNPYWNTSIYGAWAAVRYNDTAKGLICTPVLASLTAGSTCNPDFDIGQIGTKTSWTPVKNLTFSGEFTYSNLHQNMTGSANIAQVNSAFKPAAVYEFKDQNPVVLMFRAQRNW